MSYSRGPIVNSKYGARALIEMPPIALEGDHRRKENIPDHVPRHDTGGNRQNVNQVYYQPSRTAQPSLTVPLAQPRYQEPLVVEQNPRINLTAPQLQRPYAQQYHTPPAKYNTVYPHSNLIQNSNIVPYDPYQSQPAFQQQAVPSLLPAAPPMYPSPHGYHGNATMHDANGEVHIFYGPNGEKLPGPIRGPGYPTDFTLEGTLEYGKLVSVKVRNSNISYRDLPQFVLRDLEKMYGMIESTDIKIVAQGGEYNIYSQPKLKGHERHMGYMYEPTQPVRSRDIPRRNDSASYDHFYR